jgi:type III secretion protein J
MKIRLLSVLLIALVSLTLTACGGKVELLKDISEMEANEALAVLLDAGISAEKLPGKEGAVSLTVEKSQFSDAIRILNSEGLPHERYAKMGDVFRKEGLISSPLEERARYLWALSQELQATVSQIDGVVRARVHVVLPERASGTDPSLPSSASVFIKYKAGYNLDESTAQIKRLVSNSIPGLSAEKVTVVMLPAAKRSEPEPNPNPNPNANPNPTRSSTSKPDETDTTILQKLSRNPAPWIVWSACAALLLALALLGFLVWRRWRDAFGSIAASGKSAIQSTGQTPAPATMVVAPAIPGDTKDDS